MTETKLTRYHERTGEALGPAEGYADPRDPGRVIAPAYATPELVPEAPAGFVACYLDAHGAAPYSYLDGAWVLRRDCRTNALYFHDGRRYEIGTVTDGHLFDGLGELPDWLTDLAPPTPDHVWDGAGWALDAAQRAQRLADSRAAALTRINADCEAELAKLKLGFPASEVDSWAKQEREARALQTNPAAQTTLLSAIAVARGLEVAELAARVIAKADAYAVAAGALIGRRQALEDALGAIDIEEPDAEVQIDAILWEGQV